MKDFQDYMQLHLCFDGTGNEVEVIDVTQLDDITFKIEENPVFTEKVSYGDIIKVRWMKDVALYIETIKKSKFTRYNWLLSKEVIHSLELKILKNKIREWKGKSEQVFGGIFIVNLPANSSIDIHDEVQKVIQTVQK
ncbi:DUF4265 domain-containing protein [Paenibacillus alkaliterrae]|uniref:DUF4265 domain-containing protein n=1 Tax=Paenibacillus alkaliterrae TaxID=320909 RepID=UPI001F437932|nr:DUF4265 domain-containing protein [Paenibacillus alkaliterrae]MCF2938580.1 DUF4265 domain-containing protein [Paenibacillus alkaliterrae]